MVNFRLKIFIDRNSLSNGAVTKKNTSSVAIILNISTKSIPLNTTKYIFGFFGYVIYFLGRAHCQQCA